MFEYLFVRFPAITHSWLIHFYWHKLKKLPSYHFFCILHFVLILKKKHLTFHNLLFSCIVLKETQTNFSPVIIFNELGVSVSLNKDWQSLKKIPPNFGGFDMNSSGFWFWNVTCVAWLKLWIFQSWTVSFYLFCHGSIACSFILFCLGRQRTTWLKGQIIYLNGKRFWPNSQICCFNKQCILCKWSGLVFSVSKA